MLEFINRYREAGAYSQNGEQGIIDECIKRIKPKRKVSVEFGCPDTTYCSNTKHLEGFKQWYYGMSENDGVIEKRITPDNVNELPGCSVLSIDVDGNDYNIWKAYTGKPDIVVIEINSSMLPLADGPVSDFQHGTAYKPMVQLGLEKGYFLLGHTGNLVFVKEAHRKLFPEIEGDGIDNYDLYFDKQWLKR